MNDFLEFYLGGYVEINGVAYRKDNVMFAMCNGAADSIRSTNHNMWPGLSLLKDWHSAGCALKDNLVDADYRSNLYRYENHIGCPLCNGHMVVPRALNGPINSKTKIRFVPKGFRVEFD